jgi:hypothetical protein
MEIQEVLALYNSQKVYQIKELPIMPEFSTNAFIFLT